MKKRVRTTYRGKIFVINSENRVLSAQLTLPLDCEGKSFI